MKLIPFAILPSGMTWFCTCVLYLAGTVAHILGSLCIVPSGLYLIQAPCSILAPTLNSSRPALRLQPRCPFPLLTLLTLAMLTMNCLFRFSCWCWGSHSLKAKERQIGFGYWFPIEMGVLFFLVMEEFNHDNPSIAGYVSVQLHNQSLLILLPLHSELFHWANPSQRFKVSKKAKNWTKDKSNGKMEVNVQFMVEPQLGLAVI